MNARFVELRGLFSLLVLAGHTFPGAISWFWIAMEGFFVLSGFLITNQLLSSSRSDGYIWRFLLRRLFRTWPVYLLLLATVAVTVFALDVINARTAGDWSWELFNLHLLFMQNVWLNFDLSGIPSTPFALSQTWSVALEEQFYLILVISALVLSLLSSRPAMILVSCVLMVFIVAPVCNRIAGMHWWAFFARTDALAAGVLLAFVTEINLSVTRRTAGLAKIFLEKHGVVVAYLAFIALVTGQYLIEFSNAHDIGVADVFWGALTRFYFSFAPTFAAILFILIVANCVLDQEYKLVRSKRVSSALVFTGRISYSLYLFHPFFLVVLGYGVREFVGMSDGAAKAVAGLLCIPLCYIIYATFEAPLHRYARAKYRI